MDTTTCALCGAEFPKSEALVLPGLGILCPEDSMDAEDFDLELEDLDF